MVDGITAGRGRVAGNAKEDTTSLGSALAASAGDDKNKDEAVIKLEKYGSDAKDELGAMKSSS